MNILQYKPPVGRGVKVSCLFIWLTVEKLTCIDPKYVRETM